MFQNVKIKNPRKYHVFNVLMVFEGFSFWMSLKRKITTMNSNEFSSLELNTIFLDNNCFERDWSKND